MYFSNSVRKNTYKTKFKRHNPHRLVLLVMLEPHKPIQLLRLRGCCQLSFLTSLCSKLISIFFFFFLFHLAGFSLFVYINPNLECREREKKSDVLQGNNDYAIRNWIWKITGTFALRAMEGEYLESPWK